MKCPPGTGQGWMWTSVPIPATDQISRISASDTAMQPAVPLSVLVAFGRKPQRDVIAAHHLATLQKGHAAGGFLDQDAVDPVGQSHRDRRGHGFVAVV